jgi:tetratricopeptide (TPR) repeat protein
VIEQTPIAPEEVQQSLFGLLFAGVVECGLPRAGVDPTNEPLAAEPASELPADPEPVAAAEAQPPLASVSAPAIPAEASAARRREIQDALRDLLHRSHFEVLGVPRGASDLEIREAYFRLVKQFHPDHQTDPALADLKKELEALFIRIGEAYEVLSHPRRRAHYEAELAGPLPAQSPEASREVENALLADDAIRKAEQFMEESQYWDAIQVLEAAIPQIQSSRLRHEAQVRLARAYTRNPKWVRRGEELLQAVVREDPSWVDAYYVLGTIYRGNGLKSRAVSMFRKVLELRPSHRPAAAEIRSLEGPPAATKPPRRT